MADPKLKFKRSSVAGKRPTLANIDLGELALNTYDGKVFLVRDTSGVGIATTVSTINPWTENYGSTGISYDGNVNIVGITTISGLKYPSSDGTPNQVLVTDGSGNLSFADQSGSSSSSSGPGVTTTNSTAQVGIDSFAKATYQSAIYNVQSSRGTDYELTTINIIHDSTQAYITEYGTISTGSGIATYSADVDGSYIRLLAYPSSSTTTVFKLNRTLIGTGVAGITSTSTSSTSQTSLNTFDKTTYNAVMYEVQARRGTAVHTTTIHLVHNGTTVSINEFAGLRTDDSLGTYDADISGSLVRLLVTPTSSSTTTYDVRRTFFS